MTLRALRPLAAAAVLLAAGVAHAQSARPVLPGWWEYTSSTAVSAAKTDRRCVRPDQIAAFVSGPSNGHYRCTYPVKELGGGRARFEGVCVSKHGARYPVRWEGTYTPESFDLHGTVRPNLAGLEIPVSATIAARRLAAQCPAAPAPAPG